MAQAQAIKVDGVLMIVCEWFATCGNGTLTVAEHPILDLVPICTRCTDKVNRLGSRPLVIHEITVG